MEKQELDTTPCCHVAIVGFGPKGLYALAQLVAEMKRRPHSGRLEVHLFEKCGHFGAGQVYRPDQPTYLKMNIPAIDVRRSLEEAFSPLPEVWRSIDAVGDKYRDYEFMPRSEVGKLLLQAYHALLNALPLQMAVREWRGEAKDIVRDGEGAKIVFGSPACTLSTASEALPYNFRHILLATGHPGNQAIQNELLPFYHQADGLTSYEPSVYPVQHLAASAKTNATVIVRGMGLTFIDAALGLTEGRGGQFAKSGPQRYRYLPSGKEPRRIVPFSRSGLLMPARGALHMIHPHRLRFFTTHFAERLLMEKRGAIDFDTDLWPHIEAEYLAAYYGCLMPAHGFDAGPVPGSSHTSTKAELHCRIAAFHQMHSSVAAFDPGAYLQRMGTEMLTEDDDYHSYSKDAIARGIDAAVAGPERSPLAAVANVWRAISPVFNTLYSGGALNASSHEYFDKKKNGQLQNLSFGPCVDSMKKLLALAEAGIIDFGSGPGAALRIEPYKRSIVLQPRGPRIAAVADVLIDARIARLSLGDNMPPLYARLLESGQIRPLENISNTNSYRPGCPDMDNDGRAVDGDGLLHPVLTFAGTPTEGYFYDNDTLSSQRNNTIDAWAGRIRDTIHENQDYEYAYRS